MSIRTEQSSSPNKPIKRIIELTNDHEKIDEFLVCTDELIELHGENLSRKIVTDEITASALLRSLFDKIKLLAHGLGSQDFNEEILSRLLKASRLIMRCPHSASYIVEEAAKILFELAGIHETSLNEKEIAENYIEYSKVHLNVVTESLKCLCNTLSTDKIRQDFVFSTWTPYLLKVLGANRNRLHPEHSFLLSRILFYLYFTRDLFPEDVYPFLRLVLEDVAHDYNGLDNINLESILEGLRVLHLFGLKEHSKNTNDSRISSLIQLSARVIINLDSQKRDFKYEKLFRSIMNFLQAVNLESYIQDIMSDTDLNFAKSLLNHITYTLSSYSTCFLDVEGTSGNSGENITRPFHKVDTQELDFVLCPMFHVARHVMEECLAAKNLYKTALQSDNSSTHLLPILTSLISPYRNDKHQVIVGNAIYTLCDENSSDMIKLLGLGHASGYLQALKKTPGCFGINITE